MIHGVANQVVIDAKPVGLALETVPAAVFLRVLEGRDHHFEGVLVGAPGVRRVPQCHVVGPHEHDAEGVPSLLT